METKVHVHLHANDLAQSREFYRTFFGAAPVKEKPGYIKFLPDLAPLNLAITQRPTTRSADGSVSHFGFQVGSPATVIEHLRRVKAAGLPVREEMGVDCCHANQDKFWVCDPDGNEWEVYHLNHDIEDEAAASATAATVCCAGGSAPTLIMPGASKNADGTGGCA